MELAFKWACSIIKKKGRKDKFFQGVFAWIAVEGSPCCSKRDSGAGLWVELTTTAAKSNGLSFLMLKGAKEKWN